MSLRLTWLSHASWLIELNGHRMILDPFFQDNPAAQQSADDFENIDDVLVSHGHFDHVMDVESVARKNQSRIIANFEIAQWFNDKGFGSDGLPEAFGMNIGAQTDMPFGKLKMVPAVHSSSLPDGSYGGTAAGFLLTTEKSRIYFACDTAYFSDMKFYASDVDLAVLPIGDLFTMGVDDCIKTIRLINPARVLPTHYDTWPPISQDVEAWADRVRQETIAKPFVLKVGETFELDN